MITIWRQLPFFLLVVLFLQLKPSLILAQQSLPSYPLELSTYSDTTQFSKEKLKEFLTLLEPLKKGTRSSRTSLNEDWNYAIGDPAEGISTSIQSRPALQEEVDLPHRVQSSDTPIWYTKTIDIAEESVLFISADDGAQLFVNGSRILRSGPEYFHLSAGKALELTVRVLNNAMAGGLRRVEITSMSEFGTARKASGKLKKLMHLLKKASHFRKMDSSMLTAVHKAFTDQDEKSLAQAEALFVSYPYLLAGPYLQKPTADSTLLLVETDNEKCNCTLYFGKEPTDLNHRIEVQQTGQLFSFLLPQADLAGPFFYRVACDSTYTKIYKLRASQESEPFSFNVWGDSQGGWETFSAFVENFRNSQDAFGIGLGDLVNNGANTEEWLEFFQILSRSGAEMPFYLLAGNHDYDGYYDHFQPELFKYFVRNGKHSTYFYWKYQNCFFVAMDPNENFPIGIPAESAQFKWLHEQINSDAWKQADWRFLLLHQPPYSQGWAGYHGDAPIRQLIESISESAQVDFVISGHTHDYERLTISYKNGPTTYLILGGAGGRLEGEVSSTFPQMDKVVKQYHIGRFTVDKKNLTFQAIGVDEKVLDSFILTK